MRKPEPLITDQLRSSPTFAICAYVYRDRVPIADIQDRTMGYASS